jgi:hypothetical protein
MYEKYICIRLERTKSSKGKNKSCEKDTGDRGHKQRDTRREFFARMKCHGSL